MLGMRGEKIKISIVSMDVGFLFYFLIEGLEAVETRLLVDLVYWIIICFLELIDKDSFFIIVTLSNEKVVHFRLNTFICLSTRNLFQGH